MPELAPAITAAESGLSAAARWVDKGLKWDIGVASANAAVKVSSTIANVATDTAEGLATLYPKVISGVADVATTVGRGFANAVYDVYGEAIERYMYRSGMQSFAVAPFDEFGKRIVSMSLSTDESAVAQGTKAVGNVEGGVQELVGPQKALTRGEQLRQKYGNLSAEERQATIWQRTEDIARQQLEAKEGATSGAHFMERHSPQVPLYDQLVSAATGMRPDGKIMGGWTKRFTVDSTQFLSNKDMLYGINRAERIQQYAIAIGNPIEDYISFRFSDIVGEGFVKNTPMFGADLTKFYRQTKFANFGIDSTTGEAVTAFPVLSDTSLGVLY